MKQLTVNRRYLLTAMGGLVAAGVTPVASSLAVPPAPQRSQDIIDDIIDIAARSEGLTRADILGPLRSAPAVRARQRAMYLSRQATPKSLPELGRRFGSRDHTTVLHALRKIAAKVEYDAVEAHDVAALRRSIAHATGIWVPDRAVIRWELA